MDHIGRLVHSDVRTSDLECARQRSFIATRLAFSFVALVALALSFALGHVPAPWEAVALAWLTVPLGAAAFVSRTGRLKDAEVVCLAAWVGFAITASLGGGVSLYGACALLIMVPLEAAASPAGRTVYLAALLTVAGLAVLFMMCGLGLLPANAARVGLNDGLIVGMSVTYGFVLVGLNASLQDRQFRSHVLDEKRHRVLAEAVGDLVLNYDRAGGVLTASREAERLFGIAPAELLGRGFFERVHVADRPAFLKLFSDAATSGDNVSTTLRLRTSAHESGRARFEEPVFAWVELRARRFGGHATGESSTEAQVVAVVRDVTAQMQHEQAIKQARDEAERANLWKDGFLANVSHELRTPLNAIIGFSEILSNAELSPPDHAKQREYAEIIMASGQHLLSVVNSLLDISKMEAGRFDIDPEPFDVPDMIQACCDMVGLSAKQAGIAIVHDRSARLDDIVGDKRACKQIVINLLSNALKFTPRGGGVTVGAKPQGNSILISVADTGVGIAPMDLTRLGDAFFQAKSGYDRPFEGTGLGLSVVRGLVGLHGGNIAVESAPGEGTRVVVRLPVDCRTAGSANAAAKIDIVPRSAWAAPPASLTEQSRMQRIA